MLYIYSFIFKKNFYFFNIFIFVINLNTDVIIIAVKIRRLVGKLLALDHMVGKLWGWDLDLKLSYFL